MVASIPCCGKDVRYAKPDGLSVREPRDAMELLKHEKIFDSELVLSPYTQCMRMMECLQGQFPITM
eukprot:5634005-Amphidinium_carterae.1